MVGAVNRSSMLGSNPHKCARPRLEVTDPRPNLVIDDGVGYSLPMFRAE